LIHQENEIPNEIVKITGITNELISERGVGIKTVINEFIEVISKFNPTLIAHNIEFDLKVIQSSLLKNNISFDFKNYRQVCTMKASKNFCNLPNFKYPKLEELYFKLFSQERLKSHRAIYDTKDTAKSFFKLIELGILEGETENNKFQEIDELNKNDITTAITDYKTDLNKYPIFYDAKDLGLLNSANTIESTRNKYNEYYQTDLGKSFDIPYDRISNRSATYLTIEDTLIRYVLKNKLKNYFNLILSSEKYNNENIQYIINNGIEEHGPILIKIDIFNFYEEINHDNLISVLTKRAKLNPDSIFLKVFRNALKTLIKKNDSKVYKKEKGVLIGQRPDQYFAEFYLNHIANEIKEKGIFTLQIADEFLFFSEDIDSARHTYKEIERIINNHNLLINKHKTTVQDLRGQNLAKDYKIELKREIIPGNSDFPMETTLKDYRIKEFETDVKNNEPNSISFNHKEIDSYETAKSFLEGLVKSKFDIERYRKNYPKFEHFWNIRSSQPTDFKVDFEHLDKSLFSIESLEKLREVIYKYPKSEYYSAQAIYLLVFVAKNTVFWDSSEKDKEANIGVNYSDIWKYANVKIVEILESEDIHDYQKYILLRCLFKDEKGLSFSFENFKLNTVINNEIYPIKIRLPFKKRIKEIVNNINTKTEYYPLKMITDSLL